ncbi:MULTISPECIES: DmsC/YnfH family molybdoenzyme membrane anchor subunit [unclassified Virgibacillus]|uniref:dimethyl sulfoxide reductase anchor subunit family protein n=1 Tax=unclassified Virgibacillus TaxID=2620237 RepID=UPI000909E5A5|nr:MULTISPECIES: DmsC/YnfH family molybdoenzyme membrane anchor subunit [unclassified Virgibacillus]API92926.1 cyclic nucleotide-binding protein [Virgibacillus sp. 6R]MBS7428444.1 dimethyl sulfoxide reductase anchor subunit [Virgibacillus sp. 19R1-5]
MNDWSLLIFTIAIQAAIGSIWMLWMFQFKHKKKTDQEIFQLFKVPLIVIAALSIIGLGASFSHLGTPSNAFNTIRNIGSSWMSREILVTGMFIGIVVVACAWALYRQRISPWLLFGAGLIGLVDVYCMAAIYTNSLVGPWNSIYTFMSFYGTTFILGSVLAGALLTPVLYKQKKDLEAKQFLNIAFIIMLSGVALQVIGVALFPTSMQEINMIGETVETAILSSYKGMIASRWIISIVGIALFGYLTISTFKKLYTRLMILTLLLFVMSEGLSRYVFYLLGS